MDSLLVAAWRMSNETNLFLLGKMKKEHLECGYSARTRTVAAQFAHMHNVRMRCLQYFAGKSEGKTHPFPRGAQPSKVELKKALTESAKMIGDYLEEADVVGKVKNWNGPPATFLGYLIAHEAHHRGLAMVALRMSGHKLPQEVVYGQWDWGKKRSMR